MQCQQTETNRSGKPTCQDAAERLTILAQHLGQPDLRAVGEVKPRCPSDSCCGLPQDLLQSVADETQQSGKGTSSNEAQQRKMSLFSKDFEESGESVSINSSEGENEEDAVNNDLAALESTPLAQIVQLNCNAKCFKLRSCAGLSGDQVVAEFTCVLQPRKDSGHIFYVFIGSTGLQFFDKHTFMNLTECAEQNGAHQVVFLLDAEHTELKGYRHTFKVLDADRVSSTELTSMLKPDLVAKEIQKTTKFYQMQL